jgi:hypothetical protein
VAAIAPGWPDAGTVTQAPGPDRVRITDPARLAFMGFPPDARNVYVHVGVLSNVRPPEAPLQEFGFGAGANYTSIPAKAFDGSRHYPGAAQPNWQYTGGDVDCCLSLTSKGTETFADATFNLPPGVAIQNVRYWANDSNVGADLAFFIYEACNATSAGGGTVYTELASGTTSGSTGYQGGLLSGSAVTINNRDCTYNARLRFDATTDLTFQKMRVEWRRQVSAAPAIATFVDVPVSHFFFRWIEALAASGITAGCGPGPAFCPDNPVTRAQMAVFLSVALGLHAQ